MVKCPVSSEVFYPGIFSYIFHIMEMYLNYNLYIHDGYSDSQTNKYRGISAWAGALACEAAGSEPLVQVTFEGGKRCLI